MNTNEQREGERHQATPRRRLRCPDQPGPQYSKLLIRSSNSANRSTSFKERLRALSDRLPHPSAMLSMERHLQAALDPDERL